MVLCPCTLPLEHLGQHSWLVVRRQEHVNLLKCALLQALFRGGFRQFEIELPNLRDGTVDDLVNDVIGDSPLLNELDHLPCFLPNPWNWYGDDLLHCAFLRIVLWSELHSFNGFLHHLRNRDVNGLFSDALISVEQLILVVISDRIPVATDLMSQDLCLGNS